MRDRVSHMGKMKKTKQSVHSLYRKWEEKSMNMTVTIPLDEYRELCLMKGRYDAYIALMKRKGYVAADEALMILEGDNAGKPDAD